MRNKALAAGLLAGLCSLSSANEPRRVELEIPKPDAKANLSVTPLPGQVGMAAGAEPLAIPGTAIPETVNIPEGAPAAVKDAGIPLGSPAGTPSVEMRAAEGQAEFDLAKPVAVSLDAVIARTASRKLDGVFIQQEQEGSLLAADPRDSSGNVFRYYRPVEMRPELMAEVQENLGALGKVGYGLRRSLNFWDKDPYKTWNAWSVSAKLSYLGKLEAAVTAEKGKEAAWREKVSLILERSPGAPSFITPNPHMENPPAGYQDTPGARFLQPEIVSDKDHPAATINEAMGRSRMIIAETGHAGTQYHVFLKAEPKRLETQMAALQSALQLVNNALFARAATESFQNVAHPSLLPWHAGRSRRVAELIAGASAAPHTPQAEDEDSEKHSFVGLRYWGLEGGKAVISFELRGASIPWKQRRSSAVRGGDLENPPKPERDYALVQYYLTFLSLYAEKLSAGRAPLVREPALDLDAKRADALIAARAGQRGIPIDAYYGVEDFGKRLSGVSSVPPGYLFPFAASAPGSPAIVALIDEFIAQSARVRALDRAGDGLAGERRNIEYMFWSAYREWALSYEAQSRRRLTSLFAASAAP
ncbi:MAG: hypothetical protein HY077_14690 [Elusimicrobia bacterium]|nr:hypothetical protein [Elusimicrobiota bacterium]